MIIKHENIFQYVLALLQQYRDEIAIKTNTIIFFSYQKYLCLDFYLLSSFATFAILLLLINGQAEHMYHNGIQVINGKCFNYKVEHILVNSIVCVWG